jgi:hypothetical protein
MRVIWTLMRVIFTLIHLILIRCLLKYFITKYHMFHSFWSPPNSNFSDLNFFCTFVGIKKQIYLHTTFSENTVLKLFFAFPQCSAYTFYRSSVSYCGLKTKTTIIFYSGSLKMELPKIVFLIFFKLDKLVEDFHLFCPSKPLEVNFCCLENIDFRIWSPFFWKKVKERIWKVF